MALASIAGWQYDLLIKVIAKSAAWEYHLMAGQTAVITVTVTIPDTTTVRGLTDITVVTATSTYSPTLASRVTDTTRVSPIQHYLYLPVVLKNAGG